MTLIISRKYNMKIAVLLFSLLMLIICAVSPATQEVQAKQIKSKISRLETGMKYREVRQIMGEPDEKETYMMRGRIPIAVWIYFTEHTTEYSKSATNHVFDDSYIPLFFRKKKLTGWSRKYLDNTRMIDQDIKQKIIHLFDTFEGM
jgi:outer membrane protein assembly factor BamE (lipoprotein component of BamABCDE complex)